MKGAPSAPDSADSLPTALIAAYMGAATLALAGLAGAAPFLYPQALGAYAHHVPSLVLVHWVALGWAVPLAEGVLLQMAPVLFGVAYRSTRPYAAGLALHVAGTALLLAGFWSRRFALVAAGGALVLSGHMSFGHALCAAIARAGRGELHRPFVRASLLYLAGAMFAGLALAIALSVAPYLPVLRFLPLHAALGAIGWFTMLIIGISYQLLPMFSLSHGSRSRAQTVRRLLHAGVGAAAIAVAVPGGRLLWGAALALWGAAWILYVQDVRAIHRARLRRRPDPSVRAAQFTLIYPGFTLVIAAGGLLQPPGVELHPGWVTGAGTLLFLGWIGGMIVAFFPKIASLLVWHHRFSDRAGRQPAPPMAALVRTRLLAAGWSLYHAGVLGMALAAFGREPALGRGAAYVFAAGVGCLLGNLLHALTFSSNSAKAPAALGPG